MTRIIRANTHGTTPVLIASDDTLATSLWGGRGGGGLISVQKCEYRKRKGTASFVNSDDCKGLSDSAAREVKW